MKIECDKCGAKYSIADEKVRGKTFKIRCKRCSNVIIVRDKAAADSAAEAAPQPEAEAPAGWHIAVDGETLGPISEEDVRARYDAGEIDKETAVWQEGFEDWIPLGDVDAFSDLPDRPAGGGGLAAAAAGGAALGAAAAASSDDPFGASSDEGFGGGGGGLGAAAPSASEPAPAPAADPAPVSPRVDSSNLTGQRNENSVLFSLENLQAMAGGGGGGGGAASGGAKPKAKIATSAPTSEGSGLIDIRAMGAMFDGGGGGGGGGAADGGGGSGGEEEAALPSFGGGGFGGLSASPLVTPQAEAPAEAKVEEKKSSNGPLYAIVGILAVGLLGLGGYIAWQASQPEPEPEQPVAAAAPSVNDAAKDAELEEMRKQLEELKKAQEAGTKSAEEVAEAEAKLAEAEGQAGTAGSGSSGTKKKSSGGGGKTSTKSAGSGGSGGGTTAPKKEEPKRDSADDVDCLLNPSLAKCKGGGGGGSKPSGGSSAPTGGSGPAKLSSSDLLAGISKVKSAAKACGAKHGAAGKKVPVKLSISGATGKVVSAQATGEFAGTPVGNCAANELKKATFKTFQAPQQGFTYKVSM